MTEIEKVKQEIKVLEKKLALLEEIETHKSQPRMEFDFGGKFEVVSYNEMVYYRLEFTDEVYWYKRKYRFKDGMMLVHITDGETCRLLEGVWFNDVKKGKYDEPYCPDEPYRNVRVYWDKKDNPKPTILYDIIADWWDEIFINGNPSGQNFGSLVDTIESEWLPDPDDGGDRYSCGWNDCVEKLKLRLRG